MFVENRTSKMVISGLKVYAYHGKLPEEKKLGQFFLLDLSLTLAFLGSNCSDLLEDTVNYVDVIDFVKKKFREKKFNLIETVASYLCDSILEYFPRVSKIDISLKKPNPPVDVDFDYVSVEVTKCRGSVAPVLLQV